MSPHDQRMYEAGIYWILRNRAGSHNGWPPRDVDKVCGWTIVRFLADLTGRSVREVAADVIEHQLQVER